MPQIKRKKVFHVVKRLDVKGGAERIICELVNRIESHQVLVWSGSDPSYSVDQSRLRILSFSQLLWFIFRNRRQATFHLHLFPAVYLTLLFGSCCVLHEHNTWNRRRQVKWLRPLERWVYQRASRVICISEGALDALNDWLYPNQHNSCANATVIPNAVWINQCAHEARVGFYKEENYSTAICMVARFTEQKRHALLLEACAVLAERMGKAMPLVLLAGTGDLAADLKFLYGDVGWLRFLGDVDDIGSVYSSSDLNILLSHWEGFGMVVLEAAAYGVPSIVSNLPGLRSLSIGEEWVVHDDSPGKIADLIYDRLNWVINNRTLSQSQCAELVSSYGHEAYIERLNDTYGNI